MNVATAPPPLLSSDDVFGWGKPQFNPPRMNLQLTVQPLAPAPGRRSLICHTVTMATGCSIIVALGRSLYHSELAVSRRHVA